MQNRLERLYARRTFGVKPGLENTKALLAELGDPQESVRVVHVAGTNGKGSTAMLVSSLMRATGLKVGLFTSPHLVRINERFRINGEEISDEALDRYLGEVEVACAALEKRGIAPTFFECTLAMCLLWWRAEGVRLAVAEVGMGGRLDATNVLHPVLSVITRVGLDHMQYLGGTVGEIAGEKAGILKKGVPAVIGAMPEEARRVIVEKARGVGAPVVTASEVCSVRLIGGGLDGTKFALETVDGFSGTFTTGLTGFFQNENICTAAAAFCELSRVLGVDFPASIWKAGFAMASWPGRFEKIADDPMTILDGGHNEAAARALAESLKKAHLGGGLRMVIGQCADKDPAGFLRILAPLCAKVWTVPLQNPRGLTPAALVAFVRGSGIAEVRECASIAEGIELARADAREAGKAVLVCGSLFLVGEVLAARDGREQMPSEIFR